MDEKNGVIQLIVGVYLLVVTYFDLGGADGLIVFYFGFNIKKQKILVRKLLVFGGESLYDVVIGMFVLIFGFEDEKFSDLVCLIKIGCNRNSAIWVMCQVFKVHWVKGQVQVLVDNLVVYVSEIFVVYCIGLVVLEVIVLVKDLMVLLFDEKVEVVIKWFENFDVWVIVIGIVVH